MVGLKFLLAPYRPVPNWTGTDAAESPAAESGSRGRAGASAPQRRALNVVAAGEHAPPWLSPAPASAPLSPTKPSASPPTRQARPPDASDGSRGSSRRLPQSHERIDEATTPRARSPLNRSGRHVDGACGALRKRGRRVEHADGAKGKNQRRIRGQRGYANPQALLRPPLVVVAQRKVVQYSAAKKYRKNQPPAASRLQVAVPRRLAHRPALATAQYIPALDMPREVRRASLQALCGAFVRPRSDPNGRRLERAGGGTG